MADSVRPDCIRLSAGAARRPSAALGLSHPSRFRHGRELFSGAWYRRCLRRMAGAKRGAPRRAGASAGGGMPDRGTGPGAAGGGCAARAGLVSVRRAAGCGPRRGHCKHCRSGRHGKQLRIQSSHHYFDGRRGFWCRKRTGRAADGGVIRRTRCRSIAGGNGSADGRGGVVVQQAADTEERSSGTAAGADRERFAQSAGDSVCTAAVLSVRQ